MYAGGRTLVVMSFLLANLSGSAVQAQSDSTDQGILPLGIALSGSQDIPVPTAVIKLRWTAPGDDGNTGRATSYDLRARLPAYGPLDTEYEWENAFQFYNEPIPSPAGQPDSIVISGLPAGSQFYFCIRTFDEADNISGFSNSPLVGALIPDFYIAGDVNNSGEVNGIDAVFLIGYLDGMNEIPEPQGRADVNGIPGINGLDASYLITFFRGGPPPQYPIEEPIPATRAGIHVNVVDGNR
ncbi:MAG: hypothetical protein A2W25_07545 [candidate division Zixibacteria bacterium RBG_16_53_22]|nr:MAG: hypothetical protein A2W25_07545 [candidate division Zixibacteria bacterium RBG_16_53_22]